MLKIKFLDDIFSENRKYQILPQEDKTSILKDVTEYTQEGTKINALLMQSIIDEINHNTPIGVIHPYAGQTAPNGYLICDGSVVSRETYADLFQIIGTTYGVGDGKTTFVLPDLRTTTVIGANSTYKLGSVYGENEVTLSINQMPSHTHAQAAHTHTATGASASNGAHVHSASSGSAGAHTHSVSGSTSSAGDHAHAMYHGNSAGPYTRPNQHPSGSGTTSTWALALNMDSAGTHTHSISGTAASAGAHAHTVSVASGGAHTHGITVSVANASPVNSSTGGSLAHNNMQKSLAINYIIKY